MWKRIICLALTLMIAFAVPASAEIYVEDGMKLYYIADQLILQLPEAWEQEDDTDFFLDSIKEAETTFYKDGECVCRVVILKPNLFEADLGDIRESDDQFEFNDGMSYSILCSLFGVDEIECQESFSFGGISGSGVSLIASGELDGATTTIEAMSVYQNAVWYAVILYAEGDMNSVAARGNTELLNLVEMTTYTTVVDGEVYEDEETVRAVQVALNDNFIDCPVDGQYGPNTEKAIREFQETAWDYMNINGVITDSLLDGLNVYHTLAGTY